MMFLSMLRTLKKFDFQVFSVRSSASDGILSTTLLAKVPYFSKRIPRIGSTGDFLIQCFLVS